MAKLAGVLTLAFTALTASSFEPAHLRGAGALPGAPAFATGGNQVAHGLEPAETEHPVAVLKDPGPLGIRDDLGVPVQGEDHDVPGPETRIRDGAAHHVRPLSDLKLGYPVPGGHGETLTDVKLREADLSLDEVDDGASNVQLGGPLDPFQPRRGVDFHHHRSVVGAQHVNAGYVEPHGARRAYRR